VSNRPVVYGGWPGNEKIFPGRFNGLIQQRLKPTEFVKPVEKDTRSRACVAPKALLISFKSIRISAMASVS
jgi:hypothetical protein